MTHGINYGKLMHRAFRQVMADVLSQVAEEGLPGDHHFFITFDTTHPGVDMADTLRARYPREMTIVIQDWFENLAVMPDRFTVTLNFGNVPEPIVVPFEAIKTFVDPSVELGLRFDAQEERDVDADADAIMDAAGLSGDRRGDGDGDAQVVNLDKFRKH